MLKALIIHSSRPNRRRQAQAEDLNRGEKRSTPHHQALDHFICIALDGETELSRRIRSKIAGAA